VRINIEMDGISALSRQLAELAGDADAVMTEVVTNLAVDTQREAVQGIQRGPATGAVRPDGSRASAPGEYPMSDTGRLANNVVANLPTSGNISAEVGTNIQYGRYLEFGTSRMAARPWLLPSFNKAKAGVEGKLKRAIERAL
jgi:HK97 gp10 family phage protein